MERRPRPSLPASIESAYQTWVWLEGRVTDFPAHARRGLGDRMLAAAIDVLDALGAAQFASSDDARRLALTRANQRLATWRLLARGATDLRYLSRDQHAHHAEALGRLGADIGGWLKATNR
jgi:hypothetical protein